METKHKRQIDPGRDCYEVGGKVEGLFYGVAYRGRVIESHAHSKNLSHIHRIELDEPIAVFGLVRHQINVSVREPIQSGNTIRAAR